MFSGGIERMHWEQISLFYTRTTIFVLYFHKKAYENELNSHKITNNLLISITGLALPRLVLLLVFLGVVLPEVLFLPLRFLL